MTENTWLFAYGTLQDPEVLGALLGHAPPLAAAEVPGWRVVPLVDRVYPGLVADPSAFAPGKVMAAEPAILRLLDAFEDAIYERRCVGLAPGDGQPPRMQAWVIPPSRRELVRPGAWHLDTFRRSADYAGYLERVHRWSERYGRTA